MFFVVHDPTHPLDTQESQRGLAHHGELRCRERSLENGLTVRNMGVRCRGGVIESVDLS